MRNSERYWALGHVAITTWLVSSAACSDRDVTVLCRDGQGCSEDAGTGGSGGSSVGPDPDAPDADAPDANLPEPPSPTNDAGPDGGAGVDVELAIAIVEPTDGTWLSTATADCDPIAPGLQVSVRGTTTAVGGSPVTVRLGAGATQTGSVSAGEFSACVEALDGNDETLSASVTDSSTGLTREASVNVSVDTSLPGALAAPTFLVTNRREGTLELSWLSNTDTGGTPLAAYRLHCATTDIVDEASWDAALDIPVALTPAPSAGATETLGLTGFRTGTARFCVVRGEDAAGQLSPIDLGASTSITNPFLSQEYTALDDVAPVSSASVLNLALDPIGDINGDGLADFIYGVANGGADVVLGTPGLDPDVVKGPDILIRNTGAVGATLGFGAEVAGLGDVSGDGLDDFAVTARGANTVFVFFGRDVPNGDAPWPLTIDLGTMSPCPADLCVVGSGAAATPLFGWDVHSADFDGAGANDLVITARSVTVNGQTGAGRVFVLLGGTQLGAGGTLAVPGSGNGPDGFSIDPPAARTFFGVSATSVPGQGGRTDLVITASGGFAGATAGLFFVAGRAHSGTGTGLVTLSGGTDVVEVDTGPTGNFGTPVRALGDFDGDTFIDLATGRDFNAGGAVALYRGQSGGGFSASSKLTFSNDRIGLDDNYGQFMAQGFHPALGLLGDLDNDGLAELLLGATTPDAGGPKSLGTLFYGSDGASGRVRTAADSSYTPVNIQVIPNFVGDVNGDGYSDFAVLDSGAGPNAVFLMY